MAINIKNMRAWVQALRSGKYKADVSFLRADKDGFCCLGVACDISGQGRWDRTSRMLDHYDYITISRHESVLLPPEVRSWLGIADGNPHLIVADGSGFKVEAAALNDSGMSFSAIADAIERTWPVIRENGKP